MHIYYVYIIGFYGKLADDFVATALYTVLHRIVWAFSICSIILVCYKLETKDFLQRTMTMTIWQPVAKITMTMLIIYPLYQISFIYNRKIIDFDAFEIFHLGLGDIVISISLSLVLHSSVEIPFSLLEQFLFERNRKRRERERYTKHIRVPVIENQSNQRQNV